jgi:hypothetical protein
MAAMTIRREAVRRARGLRENMTRPCLGFGALSAPLL